MMKIPRNGGLFSCIPKPAEQSRETRLVLLSITDRTEIYMPSDAFTSMQIFRENLWLRKATRYVSRYFLPKPSGKCLTINAESFEIPVVEKEVTTFTGLSSAK